MFPTNGFEAGDALGAVTELQALLMTDREDVELIAAQVHTHTSDHTLLQKAPLCSLHALPAASAAHLETCYLSAEEAGAISARQHNAPHFSQEPI